MLKITFEKVESPSLRERAAATKQRRKLRKQVLNAQIDALLAAQNTAAETE